MKSFAKIIVCLATVSMLFTMMVSAARTSDAVVFADFNGTGQAVVGQKLPGNEPGKEVWLNFANMAEVAMVDNALKVEFQPDGNIGLGNGAVHMRANNGEPAYKYLVLRIKGADGNENRTTVGGLMISIGGAEGSHLRSLNDREVGIAIPALDRNGNYMPAITKSYQNFVIPLNKQNIRATGGDISINFNYVMNQGTLFFDDIYFTDTYPSDADEYKPATTTTKNPTTSSNTKEKTTNAPSSSSNNVSQTDATQSTQEQTSITMQSSDTTLAAETTQTGTNQPDAQSGSGNQDDGLSTGAMIAIILAVVLVVGGGLAALYIFVIRKKLT
ncbi:MAG TPA: hypothetical protein DEP23_04420 [Ruminococcaceae bacterium]|nr:hypothetical protein [Oscillospiraceae bacterium]